MQKLEQNISNMLYLAPNPVEPTRYEIIRYSTWRIYFYQELQTLRTEEINTMKIENIKDKFPKLINTKEDQNYYEDLLQQNKNSSGTLREDTISHFVNRMLYCIDASNHGKFIEMQKNIFLLRLRRMKSTEQLKGKDYSYMVTALKCILSKLLGKNFQQFNIDNETWEKHSHKIKERDQQIQQFIKVPIEFGETGIKKRLCFVNRGFVYLNVECAIDLCVSLYCNYLRAKLEKIRIPVTELIANDNENQLSSFLRKTLDTLNHANFDESQVANQHKLSIKNIENLWKRFFPPCMLHLNTKFREKNHLRHDGRRQLWLFFKGCGMEAHQNVQYFERHFKVSNSELKSHIYNIEHAYGLVGKKQPERSKNCRNIITGAQPKKDEYHGCPFAHWRQQELKQYLRKNYSIKEAALEQIMSEQNNKHFQVACGRLFQATNKTETNQHLPPQITNKLGKSPHEYFLSGMELLNVRMNKDLPQKKEQKNAMEIEKNSLDF